MEAMLMSVSYDDKRADYASRGSSTRLSWSRLAEAGEYASRHKRPATSPLASSPLASSSEAFPEAAAAAAAGTLISHLQCPSTATPGGSACPENKTQNTHCTRIRHLPLRSLPGSYRSSALLLSIRPPPPTSFSLTLPPVRRPLPHTSLSGSLYNSCARIATLSPAISYPG
ncbi:hypothetical protein BCV69DRAFT_82020 [Microstroma glucosiphilum]|uniref:Uncharacterized protein n=1 Tax=Pseudomicrostroma glucosiphilum TaxID=1684307 RepID=A0A316TYT6_9BASI|nr:hypothetical protein BCV69DRAFT_82020 [Pseudomicrostroma glucosiphilum]PWN18307.1 hypothetical protein BCV69DRAFT_82020 [Pseudomicrostroma glucosiphilum]